MHRLLLSAILCLLCINAFGQTNLTLLSHVPYNERLSSIWGYTAPNGTDYALVGTYGGVSIMSLANPSQPVEVQYVSGPPSIWRELKTYGNYAYVSTEGGAAGLQIINLTNLPNSVTTTYWRPELTVNGDTDTLKTIHTLWIDEATGLLYVNGSNLNQGEAFIANLNPLPTFPQYVGTTLPNYAHDCYTRGDTLWTACIYDGFFEVYDISNPLLPQFLGQQITPSNFTHNCWLNDAGNVLFTTDERANAYVTAYEVSDPTDIQELDRHRRIETEGLGVIPHNVHVLNDYVVVAHYTDGVTILDGHVPHNLVEVAQYDTYTLNDGGFFGVWGVYPYFANGMIIASDINTGLWVFQPQYVRACYLEGTITDASNGSNLFQAEVELLASGVYDDSDLTGQYAIGQLTPGNVAALYSKPGYTPQVLNPTLTTGSTIIQDVALQPAAFFTLNGQVTEMPGIIGLDKAQIHFTDGDITYTAITDPNGYYTIPNFREGVYTVTTGHWGHHTKQTSPEIFSLNQGAGTHNVRLDKGYRDEFFFGFDWTVSSTCSTGAFERVVPQGVQLFGGAYINPNEDVLNDIGTQCYLTGNGGFWYNDNDVNNGETVLTSPVFDAAQYNDPYFSFSPWFWGINIDSFQNSNDTFFIRLHDGANSVIVDRIVGFEDGWRPTREYRISDFLTPGNAMSVSFSISDFSPNDVAEAAVDLFQVTEGAITSTNSIGDAEQSNAGVGIQVYPNPSSGDFTLAYQVAASLQGEAAVFSLYALTGQLIQREKLVAQDNANFNFGTSLASGVYFAEVRVAGSRAVMKVIKL